MADSGTTLEGATLAVDIGATSIKFCPVDERGELLAEVTRVDTPYPCLPEVLVEVIARAVNASGCARAGVGFPGDMLDGVIVEPGNLSRAGGILTPVDPAIHALWVGCDIERLLQSRCDEVFGEPARARDMGEWRSRLVVALREFVDEFAADSVHVGGGNARHLTHDDLAAVGCPVLFNDNEGTLRGAVRLFAPPAPSTRA